MDFSISMSPNVYESGGYSLIVHIKSIIKTDSQNESQSLEGQSSDIGAAQSHSNCIKIKIFNNVENVKI